MRIRLSILLLVLAWAGQAAGATYYADPDGSGTTCSEAAPCTLVYTVETKATAGDTVYVNDGSYREGEPINIDADITIIGSGEPILYGDTNYNTDGNWTRVTDYIYRSADGSFATEVGLVFLGSVAQGNVGTRKTWDTDLATTLASTGDWWWDDDDSSDSDGADDCVYVRTAGASTSPVAAYSNIYICYVEEAFTFNNIDGVTIQNINIQRFAKFGILAYRSNNVLFDDVDITWIGKTGTGPSGDGITYLPYSNEGYSNVEYKNCDVSQVFDSCLNFQMTGAGSAATGSDLSIHDCTCSYAGAGIVFGNYTDVNQTMTDFEAYNNTITNIGKGWSGTDNSVGGIGIKLGGLSNEGTSMVNGSIHDNIINTFTYIGIQSVAATANIYSNKISGGEDDYVGTAASCALQLHGVESGADETNECRGNVHDNVIYDNESHGIYLRNNTASGGTDLVLSHNTLYNNASGAGYFEIYSSVSAGEKLYNNNVFATNALCLSDSDYSDIGACDYNNFYRATGNVMENGSTEYATLALWASATSLDGNSISSDPLFTNASGGDFTLQSGSPCIDAGTYVKVDEDFNGWFRPQGTDFKCDIGAHEYQSGYFDINGKRFWDQKHPGAGDQVDTRKATETIN